MLPAAVFRGPAMKLSLAAALGFTGVMGLAIFFCPSSPFCFSGSRGAVRAGAKAAKPERPAARRTRGNGVLPAGKFFSILWKSWHPRRP